MHHSCLCHSANNLMSAKTSSQVVDENVFGQSTCSVSLIFIMLKTIWKPMYFMISNTEPISTQCYFKMALIQNK